MWPTWISWFSCLYLPTVRITGVCHYTCGGLKFLRRVLCGEGIGHEKTMTIALLLLMSICFASWDCSASFRGYCAVSVTQKPKWGCLWTGGWSGPVSITKLYPWHSGLRNTRTDWLFLFLNIKKHWYLYAKLENIISVLAFWKFL